MQLKFLEKIVGATNADRSSVAGLHTLFNAQGRIEDFFWRVCTRVLLYFNTNKPYSFFLQNTSCIRKPQVISEGGGGGEGCAPTVPSP